MFSRGLRCRGCQQKGAVFHALEYQKCPRSPSSVWVQPSILRVSRQSDSNRRPADYKSLLYQLSYTDTSEATGRRSFEKSKSLDATICTRRLRMGAYSRPVSRVTEVNPRELTSSRRSQWPILIVVQEAGGGFGSETATPQM